jgi:hypothetical protein
MTILGGAVGGIFMGLSTAIVSLRWDIIPISIIYISSYGCGTPMYQAFELSWSSDRACEK